MIHEEKIKEQSEQLTKHQQRLKIYGKLIIDVKGTLNLLESITEKLHQDVIEDKNINTRQRDEVSQKIDLFDQSVKSVAGRGNAQDSIMQEIVSDMKELLIRKQLDIKIFKILHEKIKIVEQKLQLQAAPDTSASSTDGQEDSFVDNKEKIKTNISVTREQSLFSSVISLVTEDSNPSNFRVDSKKAEANITVNIYASNNDTNSTLSYHSLDNSNHDVEAIGEKSCYHDCCSMQ